MKYALRGSTYVGLAMALLEISATRGQVPLVIAQYDQAMERGAHHRILQFSEAAVDPTTGLTNNVVNQKVIQLESGLHYLEAGQWVPSEEFIVLTEAGAVAQKGPMKVRFSANLNSVGAIDLTTPDGKRLRSNILGLSYYDAASGTNVLLAQVKDTIGELEPPNVIIYKDAFDTLKADVRYTYRKGSFEQDVILLARPPAPEEFGLDSATTRLEVLTEFLQPPEPEKTVKIVKAELDAIKRLLMEEPDIIDEDLDFGDVHKGWGKAFSVPAERGAEHVPFRNVL